MMSSDAQSRKKERKNEHENENHEYHLDCGMENVKRPKDTLRFGKN